MTTTTAPTDFGTMSPKQLRSVAMSTRAKHAIWVGAVGAGKTVASLLAFLIAIPLVPQGELIVIVGNTIQSIERNVINPLQNVALYGPLARLVTHTRGSSTATILGREVELVGASNVQAEARIRGGSFALCYVDEITLLKSEFWLLLLTRLRITRNGVNISRLIGSTNPASQNHWLRTGWILRPAETQTITFHLTMDDNPSITELDRATYAAMYSGLFYRRMILGEWTNAEGAVYEQWNEDLHTISWQDMPAMAQILAVGIDHGTTNPTSAVMLGMTAEVDVRGRPAPRLVLMDEWRYDPSKNNNHRLTNVEQSALLRPWLRQHHTPGVELLSPRFVYVDPAAADFRQQLTRDRVTNWAADNAVKSGIADVSSLLSQGLEVGRPRLLVARPAGPDVPGCAGVLEEISEYRWDPKQTAKGEDEVVKEADHSLDAMRYAVRSTRMMWEPELRRAYLLAA